MIPRFKPDIGSAELLAALRAPSNSVSQFEDAFTDQFGASSAVAFPYGRVAQWAFFQAVGLTGKEVVMPAYTCSVVAHAITLSGNRPKFVDIQLDDYNPSLEAIEQAIGPETGAVILTHTFGYPQDARAIVSIISAAEKRYGNKIWLIQDCAHAFGAEYNGEPIQTVGDVSLFAFNISKIMTSIFGGMLLFRDHELAQKVRSWRDNNIQPAPFSKHLQRSAYLLAAIAAFSSPGYNLTWFLQNRTPLLKQLTDAYHLDEKIHFPPDHLIGMSDAEAAVGLRQLKKYEAIIQRRRDNTAHYMEALPKITGAQYPPLKAGATYSHFPIRTEQRDQLVQSLAKQGVELGILIQYSIPDTPPYRGIEQFPNAALASRQMINVPVDTKHPERIIAAFNRAVRVK